MGPVRTGKAIAPFACILSNFALPGDERTRESQLSSDQ